MEVPQKMEIFEEPAIPLLVIYPENNENANLKRYMHLNVHSSIIYNSQYVKATQVSINRCIVKEDVVCIYIYKYNRMEYYSVIKNNEILPFALT